MARVNYGLERAERNKAKEKKKQEKLAKRDEDAAKRKAAPKDGPAGSDK